MHPLSLPDEQRDSSVDQGAPSGVDARARDHTASAGAATLVLVIEDSATDALLIRHELARAFPAFVCTLAESLKSGKAVAAAQLPDLVLLDLSLPDSRGLPTLKELRSALPDTPVVVLTGQADMKLAIDSLRCGARDFLAKDDLRSLGLTIERVLLEARAERDNRAREAELLRSLKLESINRLAAGIAHEINSPIQYIGDNLVFLRRAFQLMLPALAEVASRANALGIGVPSGLLGGSDDVKLRYAAGQVPAAIEQALEGVSRIERLVATMKEHCGASSGQLTSVDIRGVLETSLWRSRDLWQPLADVVAEYGDALPRLAGYRDELVEAFSNVIINAAEAIGGAQRDGKGTIHIRVSEQGERGERGERLEIRIGDDGPGLSEQHIARVFDQFFTTKPIGPGVGQGLAVVHAIVVQKHGGSVQVESPRGQGATFIISLPLGAWPRPERSEPA